jgi:hypothetical protein
MHTGSKENLDRAYLRAKLNVRGNDRDLADGNNQDCADYAQESEHIVVTTLVLPKALENEHELNEEHGKWNQAGKQCSICAMRVPRLCRDLSSNCIGLGRVTPRFCSSIAIPTSSIDERHLN